MQAGIGMQTVAWSGRCEHVEDSTEERPLAPCTAGSMRFCHEIYDIPDMHYSLAAARLQGAACGRVGRLPVGALRPPALPPGLWRRGGAGC